MWTVLLHHVGFFGQLSAADADSVVVLAAGATATLGCLNWFGRRNCLEKWGISTVQLYPAFGKSKFGRGRLGEPRDAAGMPEGVAGVRVGFAACLSEAGTPA